MKSLLRFTLAAGLAATALGGCASVKMNLVNTREDAVKSLEVKVDGQSSKLAELAPGAIQTQELKVKKASSISVNYLDAGGHQVYSSPAIMINPGDSGWVQLSITARGTVDVSDGRKK